jgi:hypothetical protein
MDLGRIISRSFEITIRNRALWLFGILLAIFGGDSANLSSGSNFSTGGGRRDERLPNGGLPQLPQVDTNTIITILAVVACIVLILILLSIIVRLVSRGALIGLVQELEANQTRPTVRRGFNIGFDRFWSLLGVALAVNVPLFLISLLLLLLAAVPLLAALIPLIQAGRAPEQMAGPAIAGVVSSIVLICCVVIFLGLVQLVLLPFYQFFIRACVIGRRGALDSIREGYRLVRANLGNVILLYLVLFGLGIVYFFVVLVLVLILLAIVGGIAVAVGIASQSATPAVIVGILLGIPALLLLLFVGGLYQVFDSTMWTEGYLALASPAAPAPQEAPAATV